MILILGRENSAKTALAIRMGKKIDPTFKKSLYIDWDGTGAYVAKKYYEIKALEPEIKFEELWHIDYQSKIVEVLSTIMSKTWKVIIFDGLSNFLSECEMLMRIGKDLEVDDAVKFKYWMSRNQIFLNTLKAAETQAKALISTAHTDFLLTGDDSKVYIHTNAKATVRLQTTRGQTKTGDIAYMFKITKAKHLPWMIEEGAGFMKIIKKTKSAKLLGDDIIDELASIYTE